jgi:putative ABC transport system permease protein
MIRNYLKIAWRNLWKNKVFSVINILGLAMGLACSLLIMLWVQNELSIDNFNPPAKQVYQIIERQYYDNKIVGGYGTPGVLGNQLKNEIPDVQYASNFAWIIPHTFQVNDKVLKIEGSYADSDYFKIFDYRIIAGTAQAALNTPASLAISRKMAVDFFGSPQAALGKNIKYENKANLRITAVFDAPENVSQKFEYLLNWQLFLKENTWSTNFGNNGPLCYIQLRKNANPAAVDAKLTLFMDHLNKEQKKGTFTEQLTMQPFTDTYLHGEFTNGKIDGGRILFVKMFSVIALFILVIACINFMNLTTARSVKRAKEIGVRKVVGALRPTLIKQFIGESLMLTCIAVVVSLLLIALILPVFNIITQKQIALPFTQLSFWLRLIGITLITGMVSGSYPALFLSSFKPVKVLKGTAKVGSGAAIFRKGLVVFQFVLSVVLIISTIIISRQVNFIQDKDLGYNRENLVYINLDGDLVAKYEIFKTEVSKMPGIQSVTRASESPTNIDNGTGGVDWDGKDPNVNIQFTEMAVGYDYVSTMKLKLLQGRDFSRDFASDSAGYILNEAALKRIGYKNPMGRRLTFWGKKGTIIGLIKDFHFTSLHDPIKPLVIRLGEMDSYGEALVRTQPGQTKQALASLATVCKQLNPNFQFTYIFSDEEYQKLYNNEQVIGKLSDAFATLAIVISCLGLLGLAIFTAEQRVKEIGIRKVLGASISSLFTLLSGEFLLLVLIAFVIASPIAWYAMTKWLRGYAYHTQIEWWMFVLAGMAALLITLLTISFQAIKAAMINPVKSLRSE